MTSPEERWANLRPDQRARLEARLRGQLSPAADSTIPRRSDRRRAPLSFGQERIWFLDQLNPGDLALNRPWGLRLKGRLDVRALENSVNQIVRRHEALRTVFGSEDGIPYQSVRLHRRIKIPRTRLADLPEADRIGQAFRRARSGLHVPFDLRRDFLIRPELLLLSETDHILLLPSHHIAFDAWSESVFLGELALLYPAYAAGGAASLPDLEVQYADYAHWQRERLQATFLDRLMRYWREELAGYEPGRHPGPDEAGAGRMAVLLLPTSLSRDLRRIARQADTSLFTVLLAGFYLALWGGSGTADLAVGTLVAGRTMTQVEGLIGFFVNTLVVRNAFSPEMTFLQLLQQVREKALGALAHQELPYDKLLQELRPVRRAGHPALLDHVVQLRRAPPASPSLADLEVTRFEFDPGIAIHDLTLSIDEVQEAFRCQVHYRTGAYGPDDVDRLLRRFQAMLEGAAADPSRRLTDLAALASPPVSISDRAGTSQDLMERSNLTRNQLLIWAGERLRPNTSLYSIPMAFRIRGPLDPSLFRVAFRALVQRSDALRMTLVERDGVPRLEVALGLEGQVEMRDFSDVPDPDAAIARWLESRARRALPLASSLFDCVLLRKGPEEWFWYLNVHHLIADGAAVGVIFREMERIYQVCLAGAPAPTEALPSFLEFMEAEGRGRRSEDVLRSELYWREKLDREADPLSFYGGVSKPSHLSVRKVIREIGPDRSRRLRELAQGALRSAETEAGSICNAISAALAAYLHRATGVARISLGWPVANRASEKARRTIGLLMEVLILRFDARPDDSFVSLAGKIAREARESLSHRGFTSANPERRRAYQVTLNLHTWYFRTFAEMPVETTWLDTGLDEDLLTLRVHDYEGVGALKVDFEFNEQAFTPEAAQRAVQHFLALLDGLLEDPEMKIGSVEILTPDEASVLSALNETVVVPRDKGTVLAAFGERARASPSQEAVVESESGESVSYGALNAWAERLAEGIASRVVGPGRPVALLHDRSLATVAGLLAIWKAGAVYLPLDPGQPASLISRFLADSGAGLVLARKEALTRLPVAGLATMVIDGRPGEAGGGTGVGRPSPLPGDLAYVLYTSGSTGEPKGVMVEHGSLANLSAWSCQAYRLGPQDRVLQFSSLNWDTSLEEIVPTLASGATLVLRSRAALASYRHFLEECDRQDITVLSLPTAFWHGLCDFLASEDAVLPSRVRLVNVGGERASRARLEQWFTQVGEEVRLVNTYGLTETTAVATMAELNDERGRPPGGDVPIGRPIRNMRAYVLDDGLKPVPLGCRGQLYLAGVGLARGYWGDPSLTARSFVEVSVRSGSRERLLRTGDQAVLRPDGQLVCLGRADRLLKIRGHRLHPGEVEDWLLQQPGVREAAVAPIGGGDFAEVGTGLVAYLVPRSGSTAEFPLMDLRALAAQQLPAHMLPSRFILLEDLPRLPGGKVDWRSLPPPDPQEALASPDHQPPRDDLERRLVQAWEQILRVRPIGVRDDFFHLGGDSLLAIQLFTRMEKLVRRKLPLRIIFETPTVEGIASWIREGALPRRHSPLVPLRTHGDRPPIFWVHAAGGLALSFARLAALLDPDQPSYALQAREIDDEREPARTIEEMAAAYVSEIQRLQPRGPYCLGGLSFGGLVAWEMGRQIVERGEEVAFLGLLDTRGPGFPPSLLAGDWAYRLRQRWEFHIGNLSVLDARGKLSYVASRGRVALARVWRRAASGAAQVVRRWRGGLSGAAHRSYHAARRARRGYTPRPYPGRVVLFRAKVQPGGFDDPLLGWGGLASGGIEVHEIPGAHVSIMAEPRIRALAQAIRSCLERIRRAEAAGVEEKRSP